MHQLSWSALILRLGIIGAVLATAVGMFAWEVG